MVERRGQINRSSENNPSDFGIGGQEKYNGQLVLVNRCK
jgi:hypothetical protein